MVSENGNLEKSRYEDFGFLVTSLVQNLANRLISNWYQSYMFVITASHIVLNTWIIQSRWTTESNFKIGTIVITWLFIIDTPETMNWINVNRILK